MARISDMARRLWASDRAADRPPVENETEKFERFVRLMAGDPPPSGREAEKDERPRD